MSGGEEQGIGAGARSTLAESGRRSLAPRALSFAWRHSLRHLMPVVRSARWSGVRVWEVRLLDDQLGIFSGAYQPPDKPEYENALVEGLRTLVRQGDRVVVAGGGFGVTAMIAAQVAGPGGRVWCYEASASQLPWIRRTWALNAKPRAHARLELVHGLVGIPHHTRDDSDEAQVVRPESLPECDVLELDCEGSELEILGQMKLRPRALVVETHGAFGAPTETVRKLIESLGYTVLKVQLASRDAVDLCVAKDINVIHAVLG